MQEYWDGRWMWVGTTHVVGALAGPNKAMSKSCQLKQRCVGSSGVQQGIKDATDATFFLVWKMRRGLRQGSDG